MAIVAAHLGVVDEEQINNMSHVFFEEVLEELGHKLMYDAAVNYAGNSFCNKSWDIIMDFYPMNEKHGNKEHGGLKGLANFVSKGNVRMLKKGETLPGTLGEMKKGKANGKE